ncbi:MAG: NAD(P)-dependent oxidoreductase [Thaumarchaeota archaeon]|nr:NAD(P)-dependent oxidoreductase [Candidatus Calditenuaceae archaeon]MDW8186649.1 NAD(P)-dependent oxidoreductase [Nitrososphaerota archaeon]
MVRVGFIGLGLMGKPMAKRLHQHGHELTVHSRSQGPVEELVAIGAHAGTTPSDVAERSEVIFLMLPDSKDVLEVALGERGLIKGLNSGSIVVDCSTVSPWTEREIASKFAKIGVGYLDAPVTGGTVAAEKGTLTFMVGGDKEAFERVVPILECMGKRIEYMGPSGSGQLTKLANQIAVAGTLLASAEALVFAREVGLDASRVLYVIGSGAAGSWQLNNLGPKMLTRDYSPGFKVEHLRKDLRIVLEVAEDVGVPMFSASIVHQLTKILSSRGFNKSGTQAIIEVLSSFGSENSSR